MEKRIAKISAEIVKGGIRIFKVLFQMQPGSCRFEPSCSEYAAQAIRTLPAYRAIFLIIIRVLKCNPLCAGGYDPVPVNKKLKEREQRE